MYYLHVEWLDVHITQIHTHTGTITVAVAQKLWFVLFNVISSVYLYNKIEHL